MNLNLYAAAGQLTPQQLMQERGAFFGSICGTLNHILVGDIIWLTRFSKHSTAFNALKGVTALPVPGTLDEILYQQMTELKQQRERLDRMVCQFTAELTEELLNTSLQYKNTKGLRFSKNFGQLIQHFFNHQSHHRGQLSTLLYQAGIDVGVTDLLFSIVNDGSDTE